MTEEKIPATILVVDDDNIIVELTTLLLTTYGFDVISANDTHVAEKIIKKHNPDIVLLDYMLPDKDGMTFLKEVRPQYPNTYFIFMTGGGSTELAVNAMKAGATDYIQKPFKKDDLKDIVNNVLKIRTIEIMNRRLQAEVASWNKELEARVKDKANELERAYQQILQSEKMAILGYLSTGMAHDIRNPLNTINLFLQILKDELEGDDQKLEYLNIISDNADRVNNILEKLLETSKRPKYKIESQNINNIISETVALYEHQAFIQHVDIMTNLDHDLPYMEVDYNEIEQIFSNLIINAFHVLKSGGYIKISSKLSGDNVIITVTDNGTGINKDDLRNIFDPFFTTKEKKRGSGLGLSVVYRVITSYKGEIEVDSEIGKFTAFTITLPLDINKEQEEQI
ncbi:response regulator [Thermodesulfobacteriota bacterium]